MLASRDCPEDGPRVLDTRATPLVRESGRFVHGVRTKGFLAVTEIQCPRGHNIKDGAIAIVQDTFRCKCGVLLYALFTWQAGLLFLAEVDIHDIQAIKQHRNVVETMIYFGMPAFPVRPRGVAA
jgi:hypothetical protein